ncbi:MAG: MATE family efflux transporter [Oscillospiraceae bacterium]|nr:MATE family efflux transporter [Oscillospiraceae bacterium]
MKEKTIYRRALWLAVPMMIQNGITNAVTLVDNVMVGSLGEEAFTGVSIVGQLIFVFNLAIFGALSGPGIYGAQFFGKDAKDGFQSTVRMKYLLSCICLAAGLLVFLTMDEGLIGLYLKGESDEIDKGMTLMYARQYLRIMLLGLPPFVVTQIYAGSLRETGDSVKPMIAGIGSVLTDIVLNYLLIYGKFGFPELGVRGAAIATVAARFVELGIVVLWTHLAIAKHPFLDGVYRTFHLPRELAGKMLRKTLPIFMNEFLWAGGIAALTQCYSKRGLMVIAGLNISNALCNLLNVVFIALGNAVGILIGQQLGAGQTEQVKKNAFRLMRFTGVVSAGLTVLLIAISHVFPKLYNTTEDVRQYAAMFIIITALFFPVQGYLNALYFTLRSGGKTLVTFLFDSVYSWIVIVPIAKVLCEYTGLPILMIYAIVHAADIIKVAIGYVLIRKGVWISNLAEEIKM